MTGGFLLSPFLAGIVYAKAGYFPVFAMVIAALVLDLSLRAIMIEKRVADHWDEPGRSSDRNVNGRPQVSVKARPENGVTKGDQVSGYDREQPDLQPDAHSPLLETSVWQNIDRLPGSQALPNAPSSDGWCMRHFPATTIIFRSKRLMTAVFGIFVYMTIVASFDGALAQFVKRTFQFESSGVGLIFLALTVPALFGTAFGALSDRYGPRKVALAGFVTAAVGLGLSVLITHKSKAQIAGLSILLVLIGEQPDVAQSSAQTAHTVD
ncbi:MAG: hypothetical protein Q9169_002106 [Polycauliona sp. 2 TL-2023]